MDIGTNVNHFISVMISEGIWGIGYCEIRVNIRSRDYDHVLSMVNNPILEETSTEVASKIVDTQIQSVWT